MASWDQFREWNVQLLYLQKHGAYDQADNYGFKSDIARYEILYRFGGVYVDTDYECYLYNNDTGTFEDDSGLFFLSNVTDGDPSNNTLHSFDFGAEGYTRFNVKCEESSRCKVECKHRDEHKLVVAGKYSNCKDTARYCDYLKQAVLCEEV